MPTSCQPNAEERFSVTVVDGQGGDEESVDAVEMDVSAKT